LAGLVLVQIAAPVLAQRPAPPTYELSGSDQLETPGTPELAVTSAKITVAVSAAIPSGPVENPDLRFCLAPVSVYNSTPNFIRELQVSIQFQGEQGGASFSTFTKLEPATLYTDYGVRIPLSSCSRLTGKLSVVNCRTDTSGDCKASVIAVAHGAVPLQ
jgi:hypothetical protein